MNTPMTRSDTRPTAPAVLPDQTRHAGRARPSRGCLLAAALLAGIGTGAARADPEYGHGEYDHDRARAALERGEVRPLAEVLAAVEAAVPGDIIEVELEREHGRLVYEIKLIEPDGHVREVYVDAATAALLGGEDD